MLHKNTYNVYEKKSPQNLFFPLNERSKHIFLIFYNSYVEKGVVTALNPSKVW